MSWCCAVASKSPIIAALPARRRAAAEIIERYPHLQLVSLDTLYEHAAKDAELLALLRVALDIRPAVYVSKPWEPWK